MSPWKYALILTLGLVFISSVEAGDFDWKTVLRDTEKVFKGDNPDGVGKLQDYSGDSCCATDCAMGGKNILCCGCDTTLCYFCTEQYNCYWANNQTKWACGATTCFIATAAFGTDLDPRIDILRTFRNEVLMENTLGRIFVEKYYKYSPYLAEVLRQSEVLRFVTRIMIGILILLIQNPFILWSTLTLTMATILVYKLRKTIF